MSSYDEATTVDSADESLFLEEQNKGSMADSSSMYDSAEEEFTQDAAPLHSAMDMLCLHADNVFLDSMTELMGTIEAASISPQDREKLGGRLAAFIRQARDRLSFLEREGIPPTDEDAGLEEEPTPTPSSMWFPWAISKALVSLPFRTLGAMRSPWRIVRPVSNSPVVPEENVGEVAHPSGCSNFPLGIESEIGDVAPHRGSRLIPIDGGGNLTGRTVGH
jgi:hypothetical protein